MNGWYISIGPKKAISVISSFNIYFVFGYACFVLRLLSGFFGTRSGFFGGDRFWDWLPCRGWAGEANTYYRWEKWQTKRVMRWRAMQCIRHCASEVFVKNLALWLCTLGSWFLWISNSSSWTCLLVYNVRCGYKLIGKSVKKPCKCVPFLWPTKLSEVVSAKQIFWTRKVSGCAKNIVGKVSLFNAIMQLVFLQTCFMSDW